MRRIGTVLATIILAGCASTTTTTTTTARDAAGSGETEALALVAQAQMRMQKGELLEGLRLFKRAVELQPDSEELAEEYGLALAAVGNEDGALQQLGRVRTLSPSGEAWLGLLQSARATTRPTLEEAVGHLRAGLDAVPEGTRARLALGEALVKLGRGDEAMEVLRPLLEEQPHNPRLQLLASDALQQSGRYEEARAMLEQIVATLPDSDLRLVAQQQLATVLAALGREGEAATMMEGVAKAKGNGPAELTELARLRLRAGDDAGAMSALDAALAKAPAFRNAVLLKALLEYRDGDLDTAEQLYRRALASDEDDLDATLGLVRLLVDRHGMDEARQRLADLWQRVVDADAEATPLGAEVAQEAATVELVDRQPEEARPWLDRIEEDGLSRRTLALWSEYFRLREAWDEGLEWLAQHGPGEDADVVRLHTATTAEFELAAGHDEVARATVDRLLASEDEDDVTAGLGVLQSQSLYTEVAERAGAALERFPQSTRIRFARAASLERAEQWDAAELAFRELLADDPDNAAALNYLGYMFADRGVKLDEALDLIRRAVALEPASGAYLDSLGWVYFRMGDLDRAEKNLREAVRLEPHDATVHEHLGDLLAARGESGTAAASYREALRIGPEEAGQRERIEEKLAELGDASH